MATPPEPRAGDGDRVVRIYSDQIDDATLILRTITARFTPETVARWTRDPALYGAASAPGR